MRVTVTGTLTIHLIYQSCNQHLLFSKYAHGMTLFEKSMEERLLVNYNHHLQGKPGGLRRARSTNHAHAGAADPDNCQPEKGRGARGIGV